MKGLRTRSASADAALDRRIAAVLSDLAPLLRIEHCRIEVQDFARTSGHLTVRIEGTCPDCAGSPAMFVAAMEAHVMQRVREVRRLTIAD